MRLVVGFTPEFHIHREDLLSKAIRWIRCIHIHHLTQNPLLILTNCPFTLINKRSRSVYLLHGEPPVRFSRTRDRPVRDGRHPHPPSPLGSFIDVTLIPLVNFRFALA